jgi:urease accessory protein
MTQFSFFYRAGTRDDKSSDFVLLDAQSRHVRRKLVVCQSGDEVLIDFKKPVQLAHGDHLVLDDGRLVTIVAADEELLEVRARDAAHLARLAWHIGNRHLEAQIEAERILIRRDHVIAQMLEHQGAAVKSVREPFHPEHGAYHGHGH